MKDINALVGKLQKGDTEAFDKIYKLTNKSIYFVAYSILKNKEDSEEIVQEVYIKFYKNLSKIDTTRNVYNLLYTIAKNLSLNKLKTNKRSVTLEFAENVTEEKNETFHKASFDNLLNLALSTLKQNEFEVLSLCLIEGYKRKEVAKMLDKSVATVTWQYNNALKKLKSKLEGGGYEKN